MTPPKEEWSGAAASRPVALSTEGVTLLVPRVEQGTMDRTIIAALYEVLGEREAERRIAASVEAMALWLIDIRIAAMETRLSDAAPLARDLAETAGGLGLTALAATARALLDCLRLGEATATLAVLMRVLRLGEQALGAVLGGRKGA